MNLADVALDPVLALSTLGCAALACLFVVSAVVLMVILVRRNRKAGGDA